MLKSAVTNADDNLKKVFGGGKDAVNVWNDQIVNKHLS